MIDWFTNLPFELQAAAIIIGFFAAVWILVFVQAVWTYRR